MVNDICQIDQTLRYSQYKYPKQKLIRNTKYKCNIVEK